MRKTCLLVILALCSGALFSQRILVSWSQQNIENYTREMYDAAQKLSPAELLAKNLEDKGWSSVFLTLNASINNYSKDIAYLKGLAGQLTNTAETKLEGTSRLIIWDRIIAGDITFEGKGLVIDNDLFRVAGRANQLLQNLTKKNFGFVTMQATGKELEVLKGRWLDFLDNKPVEEMKPVEYMNAKIPEISSLAAVQAMIFSLQDNPKKDMITRKCLKNVYQLDEMPKDKTSPANFCNPDTYTFSFLAMLFNDKKLDESKDAKWWMDFWETNHSKLVWNTESGVYEVKE